MDTLDGKVAVITGGARGIGAATVERFVEEGARVVIADLDEEAGRALASRLGDATLFLQTNVSDEPQVQAVVDLAVSRFGKLDCMFNNAGAAGVGGEIDQTPVDAFDQTVGVLLRGVFLGIKHAARVMKPAGCGSIISTASVAGLQTGWGYHTYSACKAAVIHLTASVAVELGAFGLRVNAICPGAIKTGIFGGGIGMTQAAASEAATRLDGAFESLQGVPRAGEPRDVAAAALWFASDDSSFVNGTALRVDGALKGGYLHSEQHLKELLEALVGDG